MTPSTATRPAPAVRSATKEWPTVYGKRFMGTMRQIQFAPMQLYGGAWRELGDYVRLRAMPGAYFYLLSHPDAIEYVLHTNLKNFRKPNSFNHAFRLLGGTGLVGSEGDYWRQQRRMMQPALLRHVVIKLSTRIVEAIERFGEEWDQAGPDRTLDITPEMMRLALRIASVVLFSTDVSGDADTIGKAYRTAFEYVSLKMNARLMFHPLWLPSKLNREFKQSKKLLDQVVIDLIEARRHGPAQGDLIDLLLAAQDEESGLGMSNEHLKDEAITLLTAGHETTGAALSWTWYLLSQHGDIQEQLHDEVCGHLQGRTPTAADLPNLPLATAVFEESMRLYPPAWGMPRETIAADVIHGYPIPAKATIILSQMNVHRHPDFWSEPDKFDPTRFLPPNNEGRHRFAFFPFGGGPRICAGLHFAMIEGTLAVAALAQRFQFLPAAGPPVIPDPTFTLRPLHGVTCQVKKRV